MAHGGNSIAASCRSGALADPYYWRDVFDRPRPPAVMLAHMGGFNYISADQAGSPASPDDVCNPSDLPVPFENTWEASFARYVAAPPAVFGDISMFTETLEDAGYARALQKFDAMKQLCPTIADHLVFGTDWVMLAQARGARRYGRTVRQFVIEAFGAENEDRIMRTNFLRFAGLGHDGPTQERLGRVYDGDANLEARLAAVCG